MRVAASPKCANGKSGRYTLTIVMSSSTEAHAVAIDLDSNNPPVPLPVGGSATLWNAGCTSGIGQQLPTPVVKPVVVSQRTNDGGGDQELPLSDQAHLDDQVHGSCPRPGVYGRAGYVKTIFSLENGRSQTTNVEGISPLHYTIQPSKVTFEGEGYKPGGSPGPLVTVKLNETFRFHPMRTTRRRSCHARHDQRRSLRRPGLAADRRPRNGAAYRYTAELPKLVKGLLPNCPIFDCRYRLPGSSRRAC